MSTYLAPVVDVIRIALTLRNEVNRYEEEWRKVMNKIQAFRLLLNYVRTLCVTYGQHLPHEILQNINIKLDGLNYKLTHAKNNWRDIPGHDLTKTIQGCDGECSNLVQEFESKLRAAGFDPEQVAERCRELVLQQLTAMGTFRNQPRISHQSSSPPPLVYYPQQHGYDGNVPGPAQTRLHQFNPSPYQ